MPALIDDTADAELYAYIRGVIDRTHASLATHAVAVRREATLHENGTPRVKACRRTADRRKA
jgi:hypothetical protein